MYFTHTNAGPPQNSTKNKKELAAGRNEYLKAKKEKKKAKWAEIEKEVG